MGHQEHLKRVILRRKLVNLVMLSLSTLTALYGLVWLFWILADVVLNGFRFLSPELFLNDPTPPGIEGGGLRHAFVGHFIITTLATLIGVPLGIGTGIFFAEYGRHSRVVKTFRNITDVLVSFPSIVVGTFVYALMVKPVGHFMGVSGSVALALLMVPVIAITTDEILKLVPNSLREAGYALGAHRWQVIKDISLSAARRGILTGVILGIARISGETAPLLFTAFNNNFLTTDPTQPMASLTVTIFQYAMGPYEEWHGQAWAAALILTFGTLLFFISAKALVHGMRRF
ncbi:phosphate ABC transporter permease PstA [Hydrogenivirga sp. 128-5-R1-1]|uniref:phosphate ABC transporter permease PstA n=1 Tax=Hydrogenivirga sp. 128-5-R1-1 TaxID=392423 RepID=UPI00015F17D4|nr:phosphate ABC transporter permease PstA [Hydrogenivirga sp. 128-5-R1-1]EDP76024.1 phosphate transport system permease PstA [Hydrogenivirga sp. 128-5-R1-1]